MANKQAITEFDEVHRQMIDEMILNPRITNKQLGEKFGYKSTWVSIVKCSKVFQDALHKRRAEIINPVMLLDIQDRMKGMVDRAMDILDEKLNLEASEINDSLLLKSLEIGIRAIGMGNQNAEVKVDIGHLENLADRLIALHDRIPNKRMVVEMVDVTPMEETQH